MIDFRHEQLISSLDNLIFRLAKCGMKLFMNAWIINFEHIQLIPSIVIFLATKMWN